MVMAVYPTQLTAEEKNLKKRYAKLLEKRNQLRKLQEKPLPTAVKPYSKAKASTTETLSPKDAMAAAKKLLESGKLKLNKQSASKKTGFKRVGETPTDAPPNKRQATHKTHANEQQLLKQKKVADQIHYTKTLYRSFVKATATDDMERIPKRQEETTSLKTTGSLKERTIHVDCQAQQLSEQALVKAFSRFGVVEKTELRQSNKSAFVTYSLSSSAGVAVREMNRGMIRGYEVTVKSAGEEFVELSAEAAAHPWAALAAGKEVVGKKSRTHRTPTSYDTDF